MAKYNHTTLLDFRSEQKKASGDLLGVYWPEDEWDSLTQEALLTFGGLSGFFKDDIEILAENGKRVYDIFLDTDVGNCAPSLTYGDIVSWLNRDLIEIISTGSPTSDLFTLTEFLKLIEKAYNLYQSLTDLVTTSYELNVAAGINLVKISNDTINLIRVVYYLDGVETILEYVDEQEIGYFDFDSLSEEATPLYFSTTYGSPNEIRLYPIPANSGKLRILSVNGRDTSLPLNVNTLINLPNNIVPYLKYEVLAEIFTKDGLLNDPARVAYCKKRWKEGITVGKNFSSILTVKANGNIINTDSLNKLDLFNSPESTDDAPTILGLAGFNIFEVDTIPNTTINSLLMGVIQNAPIPTLDTDFVDISIEYIKLILNYTIHLAQIKSGIADIAATSNYMEDFIKIAINHNQRLQNRGISFENLVGKSKREEREKPKLVEETAA